MTLKSFALLIPSLFSVYLKYIKLKNNEKILQEHKPYLNWDCTIVDKKKQKEPNN